MTNILNLILNNYGYYCFYNRITGREMEYRGRDYCTLCMIVNYYDLDEVEEVNYKPLELMS